VVIAGILHDVLEDTAVGSDELRERFGAEVLALVEGASEPDKKDTWEERKRHTLDYLAQAPLEVCLVSCADKLDNVGGLLLDKQLHGELVWERFNRGADSQRWYFDELSRILSTRSTESGQLAALAERLRAAVDAVFTSTDQ
jgi:(p)ppGpp synthase/HD superfamily hydrolase